MHLLQIAARNKGADSLCFIQYNPPPLNRETACTREYTCRLQGTKQNRNQPTGLTRLSRSIMLAL